jgi:hypothetical protein
MRNWHSGIYTVVKLKEIKMLNAIVAINPEAVKEARKEQNKSNTTINLRYSNT